MRDLATYIKRQIPPALLFVASKRICSRGPAVELATFSIFPATNRRTIKKIEPVATPIPTQVTMIFGPSMSALGTSDSAMRQSLPAKADYMSFLPSIMCATASCERSARVVWILPWPSSDSQRLLRQVLLEATNPSVSTFVVMLSWVSVAYAEKPCHPIRP